MNFVSVYSRILLLNFSALALEL